VIVRTIGIRNSMAKKAAITVAMLMRIFSNSFFLRLYLAALFVSCEAGLLDGAFAGVPVLFCSISLP
jgi:hypothetical protein